VGKTIHIVDDDALFRKAVTLLLSTKGYETAEHNSADQLIGSLRSVDIGCILLDVRMPGLSGLDLQKMLVETGAPPPIIFLTGYADIPTTVQAVKAGADDVLTKPVCAKALFASIERALARAEARNRDTQSMQALRALVATLTTREHEVLLHVVSGRLNKQTGYALGISERTVKAHRQRIFEKLKLRTVAELATMAERLGLISGTREIPT
jgi:FixJ family two-component response regulator